MENLFSCLCSSLMFPPNRQRFLKGEGPHLMNILLKYVEVSVRLEIIDLSSLYHLEKEKHHEMVH